MEHNIVASQTSAYIYVFCNKIIAEIIEHFLKIKYLIKRFNSN